MAVTTSSQYKKFFAIAAVVVPAIMGLVGYFYGDITPIARDVCGLFLPQVTVESPAADAGIVR